MLRAFVAFGTPFGLWGPGKMAPSLGGTAKSIKVVYVVQYQPVVKLVAAVRGGFAWAFRNRSQLMKRVMTTLFNIQDVGFFL